MTYRTPKAYMTRPCSGHFCRSKSECFRFLWQALLFALFCASLPCAVASAASSSSYSELQTSTPAGESKHVLILLQEDLTWPIFRQLYENARDTLRVAEPGVLVYSEHMDRLHFPDPQIQSQRAAWIRQKYANTRLDLVIAAGDVPIRSISWCPVALCGNDRPAGTSCSYSIHPEFGGPLGQLRCTENCRPGKTVTSPGSATPAHCGQLGR